MPVHIRAKKGEVAPVVILPGDPDRAEYIAGKYLQDVRCYTEYRKMLGFTGMRNGIPVSVQTTGMGGPSAAIMIEELCMLGADLFIRIGTCGSISETVPMGTLLAAQTAMDSGALVKQLTGLEQYPPAADFHLLRLMVDQAARSKQQLVPGTVASMDLFYDPRDAINRKMAQAGVLALEMETAALYTIAALQQKKAASLLVVSDYIPDQTRLSPERILHGVDQLCQIVMDCLPDFVAYSPAGNGADG